MLFATIRQDSPEQVFVTVKNSDSVAMSIGHAVMWNFPITDAGAGTGNGYGVIFNTTVATSQLAAMQFAGVIAGRDIPSGEYGSCQVYGYHTGVYVAGSASSAPFTSGFFSVTNRTAASFTNVVLKPVAAFGNTTGAVANSGYFGVCALASTASTNVWAGNAGMWPGGYVVPLGNLNGGVTIETNASSASVKGFIRAL